MSRPRPESDLCLLALLYAGGELEGPEAEAFEARLATDQAASEALVQAVELNAATHGLASAPSPAWRSRARARLQPKVSLWQRLSGKRLYRGHPALWSLVGAAAASILLTLFSPAPPTPTAQAEPAAPLPPVEVASYWAELPSSDHLARARDEQSRRRSRLDERARMARSEEHRSTRNAVPPMKQR